MINGWRFPTYSQGLHSFIGLINWYHKYAPYFEVRIKPLRKLFCGYFCKEISLMAWLHDLIQIFEDMKKCITFSPILARFNPTELIFLKTDWSTEGMAWILMQPADDKESKKLTKKLVATDECNFGLEKTDQDYGQCPMYRVRAQIWRRNFTPV